MKQRKELMTHRVRDKGNLKLSYSVPSQGQASGTYQRNKDLCQDLHWVWGLTCRHAINEETIALNRDWVYKQACRLLHDIHVGQLVFAVSSLQKYGSRSASLFWILLIQIHVIFAIQLHDEL